MDSFITQSAVASTILQMVTHLQYW